MSSSSVGTSTFSSITTTSENSNWTEVKCAWFDEVTDLQNSYYWRSQFDGYLVLVLYAVVCSFGAFANFVVLFAFIRNANLRNIRNSFIVNLAFSDLLLCVITAPATLYLSVNLFWPFGNLSCKTLASVQAVNTFVSSLTLALIALDRALLTLCPVKWRLASTAPLVCYCIVWVMSVLVAVPYSMAVSAETVTSFEPWNKKHTATMLKLCNKQFPTICMENKDTWDHLPFSKLAYSLTVLAIQYLLPLFALAYAYVQIGSTIRRRGRNSRTMDQNRRMTMQHKNRRALLLLFVLVITYAVAWAPMNIYNVLSGLEMIQFSQYRYLFCHLVGISSACVNPITYALVNENFRAALQQTLWSFSICTRTSPGENVHYSFSSYAHNKINREASTFVTIPNRDEGLLVPINTMQTALNGSSDPTPKPSPSPIRE